MQGSWGKADVFNEMADDYVKRVNEMAGGRLRIDYLVGGRRTGRRHRTLAVSGSKELAASGRIKRGPESCAVVSPAFGSRGDR
jgi:hypothetical protein